jgi:hypothetical protein
MSAAPGHAEGDALHFWDASDPDSTRDVDHSPWQAFLTQYVSSHDDGINRVAYKRARESNAGQSLTRYVERVTATDPRDLNRAAQMAYWINLYNALTVQVVLRHPHKKSIRRMGGGFFLRGPWDDDATVIAGQSLTLNDIEHRILRPIYQDPRIHFAVNCASLGCPNLAQTAFRADTLDDALSAAERAYINHPRGVSFDSRANLRVSSLFSWYRQDFADSEQALLKYLAQRHETRSDALARHTADIDYEYDWALNSAD